MLEMANNALALSHSAVRATARLQLHQGFNFDAAAATVDYYASLGISHFYVSPIFTARPGSSHGYDVTDPTCINPELGGDDGLLRLVSALRTAGMGLVIDIVPNHMGVAPGTNRYWQDVLQWGPQSTYIDWFDIDWQNPAPHLTGKVLLPVLGGAFDAALAAGDVRLSFDAAAGRLSVACYDQQLPLAPSSLALLFASQPALAALATRFASLTPPALRAAEQQVAVIAASDEGHRALDVLLQNYDPATEAGQTHLRALLEQQHYRLSVWRNAAEEINWRRFFEVSDLAGVRVELESVFQATHALVFDLYRRGLIDGVRVDHIDGLSDPAAYCQRLRHRLAGLQAQRPSPLDQQTAWIVVEKILTPGEGLQTAWLTDGTTGYDFMDQVGAVLHDADGERLLRMQWAALKEDRSDFEAQVQSARQQLLAENFVGELDALTQGLHRYANHDSASGGDITYSAVSRVLTALLTSFRRYRCYSAASSTSAKDRRVLGEAMKGAQALLRLPDHALLADLTGWLGLQDAPADESDGKKTLRERAVTRFQQLTPPLAAKSVEDTAFYRWAPLLSRTDVGSYPAELAPGVAAFHNANIQRAADFPFGLLTTATHDHKRGEDTRARLAVLSEMPGLWAETLRGWIGAHTSARTTLAAPGGGTLAAPSPADEIMLYQALVGACPTDLQANDTQAVQAFSERIAGWQEKALREAKLHSSWLLPNTDYESACRAFMDALLTGPSSRTFLPALIALVKSMQPAAQANSLTQTLLRLTSPGVPDLYQGCDFEDLSLVDPDNRRPVDMPARRAALAASNGHYKKQQLIRTALHCRRDHPALFCGGSYAPLEATGTQAQHVIAFLRQGDDTGAIVVALRLPYTLLATGAPPAEAWGDTQITLPPDFRQAWRNALGNRAVTATNGKLALAALMAGESVALLLPDLA